MLTAIGQTSGFQATSNLAIGPGIQVNPTSGSPGSTITVSGGGYQPNETLQVFFAKKSNGVVSATTDAAGTFSASLTLPKILKPASRYHVFAQNISGSESAHALFTYNGPQISINTQYPSYGGPMGVVGNGFTANETVTLYWEYGLPGQSELGTAAVDSTGYFSYVFTMPSEPDLNSLDIAAIGSFSGLTATSTVYPGPLFILQPSSGPTGTPVKVNGGGYGANETISMTMQGVKGAPVVTTTTDATGAFTLTYTIPLSLNAGGYMLFGKGSTSGISVGMSFVITPVLTITPTTGKSQTAITVTGQSFSPSRVLSIYWYDPTDNTNILLTTVTSSSIGAFTANIKAPTNLVSGVTYYIQVFGDYASTPQVAFIAQ